MAGVDAFGTALQRSDMASSPTFTEIASVTSLSGPGISRDTYDVTAHDGSDQYREFIAGLIDAGEMTLDLNFDPADSTHQNLIDDIEDTTARNYQLVFPDTAQFAFSGWVTGLEFDEPFDGKMEASCTIKINGKPTFTAA